MNKEENNRIKKEFYNKTGREVMDMMNVNFDGLSKMEVSKRLEEHGPNELPEVKSTPFWVLFLRQFQSPLIYILIIAGIVVFLIGERIDGMVIVSVLLINAVLGMVQEGKAQNTLNALKTFTKTESRVRRDGRSIVIPDTEIVPGDIILLGEGEKIPCDARVLKTRYFTVDESALTGESFPIEKTENPTEGKDLEPTEIKNMVFKGTFVSSGTAETVAVSTGIDTVIGSLSRELSGMTANVPLKENIDKIAKVITGIILSVSIIIFILGILLDNTVHEMFLTAVAISVSVIPEGLPIVITLVLAKGVYRMGKRNALVKKLQAVEALGRADVIAVDKTGTITKNELMVSKVYVNQKLFNVKGSGYEREGDIFLNKKVVSQNDYPEIELSAKIAGYCANAEANWQEAEKTWKVIGDPTEASLLVFAEKLGLKKEQMERQNQLVLDIPFSHDNKYHATVHKENNRNFLTVVGAPEKIIKESQLIYKKGERKKMTDTDRENFTKVLKEMAKEGLRVVAFAYNENCGNVEGGELPPLTITGLYGLSDTLRPGVADSVKIARENGINVALITGDYEETARSLAKMAGIYNDGDGVITGKELKQLDEDELEKRLPNTTVFARVSPKDKLRIIELYRNRGDVIAMTGDGVNDSLSLVAADLGIAMGKIGTEVTKEASDIVLLDDNFKSIINAIEEGQAIFKSVKKVLLYLFSTGFGELFVIVFALILLLPLPLLPSQIIWLNLVTDSFLVMAFAFEPMGKLEKHKRGKKLIDAVLIERVVIMSLVMAIGSIIIFNMYMDQGLLIARTVTLTLLAVYQWVNVWNCRRENKSIFSENPFSNIYFLYALVIVVLLQIAMLYLPFMQNIFSTTALSLPDWGLIVLMTLPLLAVEEIRKTIHRIFARKKGKVIVE